MNIILRIYIYENLIISKAATGSPVIAIAFKISAKSKLYEWIAEQLQEFCREKCIYERKEVRFVRNG